MNIQCNIWSYNRILCCNINEEITHNNLNESHKYDVECEMPRTEEFSFFNAYKFQKLPKPA
jgi:hypothetical protein